MKKSIVERFYKLFAGLERAHGEYRLGDLNEEKGKVEGRAKTILEPTTMDHWDGHLSGNDGLGIIPIRADNTCLFGAVDIDDYTLDLKALSKQLEKDQIPVVVCRTKSGGAHLYMFGSEGLPAALLKERLTEISDYLGYPDAEIFPKQTELVSNTDVGNWINMPYYDMEQTLRYAIHSGQVLGVEKFLDTAEALRLTLQGLKDLKVAGKEDPMADGPPCLSKLCRTGFPEGTRNIALFSLGVYCRMKYGDDWEGELDKANHAFMHPPLGAKEVTTVAKSLTKKNYFFKCEEQPLVTVCNKALCRTRKFGIGGDDLAPPFVLGTLVKIDTEPPTWFIDVDGARIELTTEDLLDQGRFRKLCVEKLNKLPRRMKPGGWDKLVADRLDNVEVVEAPKDISPEGMFYRLFEQFIARPPGRNQGQLLAGKHIIENGRILFRGPDLIAWLEKQRFKDLKTRQVWAALRKLKDGEDGILVTHEQRNIDNRCIQLWSVPAPAEACTMDPPDLTEQDPF